MTRRQRSDVPEGNQLVQMHNRSVDDTTSFLTEFAQIMRVTGQHEKAKRAEVVRNTIYKQCAEVL